LFATAGCGPASDASSGEAVDGAAVEHDGEHDHDRAPPSHHPSDPALAGPSPPQDESTREMIAMLQQIREDAARHPRPYFHLNSLRADMLARLIERSGSVDPNLRLTYARELLFAGRTEAAIAELEGLADASE